MGSVPKLVLLVFVLVLYSCQEKRGPMPANIIFAENATVSQNYEFGLVLDNFKVSRGTVKKGETLGEILLDHNIGYGKVHQILLRSKGIFNKRKVGKGTKYTVFLSKDHENKVEYFVYQPNLKDYVVFDFKESRVYKGKKKIKIKQRVSIAKINSSLYETIRRNKLDYSLIYRLSDIYAWTIDFFRLKKGDYFKVIYNEAYVDDTVYVGIEKIESVYFYHDNKDYYAFRFETKKYVDFFDEKEYNLRKTFLKAPLKYSRISSRYSRKRYHPVLRRWKSHRGTDYAAPRGTPIMATAAGTISKVGYTRGNGNYVKMRHNALYSTQYLHMSRVKRGVKIGKKVKQGDIIGYVGSTGYATGPHVCYRFWKNGRQVDPYRQKLPDAKPLHKKYTPVFRYKVNKYKTILDDLKPNFE